MQTDGGPRLTVYGRGYCHLCDDMVSALREQQLLHRFVFDVVDVDSTPELESRYGDLVPVLTDGDREICHFRLDIAALTAYLGQIG